MADPYWGLVQLLVNAESPDSWSGAGRHDLSFSNHVTTLQGNATRSSAQAKYGTYSLAFDGVGDQLWCYMAQPINADDFTFEAWVYLLTGGHGDAWARILQIGSATYNGSLALVCTSSDNPAKLLLQGISSGSWFDLCAAGATITNDAWHHVAITKNGTAWTVWVDGASYSTGTRSYSVVENRLSLGANWSTGECFKGYMDDVRLTLKVPRYTAAFTPPGAHETQPMSDITAGEVVALSNPDASAGSARNDTPYIGTALFPDEPNPLLTNNRNFYFGGLGSISSTVKEKATPTDLPLARLVRLFTQREGLLVASTWSDPVTGAYQFINLDKTIEYFSVADDYERIYRSVIASNLVPE